MLDPSPSSQRTSPKWPIWYSVVDVAKGSFCSHPASGAAAKGKTQPSRPSQDALNHCPQVQSHGDTVL